MGHWLSALDTTTPLPLLRPTVTGTAKQHHRHQTPPRVPTSVHFTRASASRRSKPAHTSSPLQFASARAKGGFKRFFFFWHAQQPGGPPQPTHVMRVPSFKTPGVLLTRNSHHLHQCHHHCQQQQPRKKAAQVYVAGTPYSSPVEHDLKSEALALGFRGAPSTHTSTSLLPNCSHRQRQ